MSDCMQTRSLAKHFGQFVVHLPTSRNKLYSEISIRGYNNYPKQYTNEFFLMILILCQKVDFMPFLINVHTNRTVNFQLRKWLLTFVKVSVCVNFIPRIFNYHASQGHDFVQSSVINAVPFLWHKTSLIEHILEAATSSTVRNHFWAICSSSTHFMEQTLQWDFYPRIQ